MLHHMVMFRFKSGTTESQIRSITAGLATLPDQIPELVRYRFGRDAAVTDGAWDYGVSADFPDSAGYHAYSNHPAHVAVLTERITPVIDEVARVQFCT